MNLAALTDFNLVAAQGGFGRASRVSGVPKATLSRRIRELEENIGVRLIDRGARSLRLTDEGAALHARTDGLLAEVREAGEDISAGTARPRGRLRVSAPVLISHTALGRIAAGFAAAYPEVRLELVAEDRLVDPVDDGYDLVIRINPRPDLALVGRCFNRDNFLAVARPSLALSGRESIPEPGAPFAAVALTSASEEGEWRISTAKGQELVLMSDVVLRLSSLLMVRDAVLAGAGAALLPRSIVADDLEAGRLACWGAVLNRDVEMWVLHPSRRLVSPKVTAFIQHLCDAFADGRREAKP